MVKTGLPLSLRERFKILFVYQSYRRRYGRDRSVKLTADRLLYTKKSVRKYVNIWIKTHQLRTEYELSGLRIGRPVEYTYGTLVALRRVIKQQPVLYLDEIQMELFKATNDAHSISKIVRMLKKLKITRKVISRIGCHFKYNNLIIYNLTMSVMGIRKNQLVFADESYFNNRICNRKYGRSRRGCRARARYLFSKGDRYGILAARNAYGMMIWRIISDSTDGYQFMRFILEDVAPLMNAFPMPNSVLVLDNASYHNNSIFVRVLRSRGHELLWLPPYGSYLNPIELDFNTIKTYIRRNYALARRNPLYVLHRSLATLIDVDVTDYMRQAGYFRHIYDG